MGKTLRFFVSSPGDVKAEREQADFVIRRLHREFRRFFDEFEVILWEREPLTASGSFQDVITPPSETDIVIVIFWSHFGTPLPEKTDKREYRGIGGRVPVTGTEWEFEDALQAARKHGKPDILVFRKTADITISVVDTNAQKKTAEELDKLAEFWARHFVDHNQFLRAYHKFPTPTEDFPTQLEKKLRANLKARIKAQESEATWTDGTPFRGLDVYGYEHRELYWGRDEAIVMAANQLEAHARNGAAFLLISGASGSGKSSLAQAGLLPRLIEGKRIEGAVFLRRLVFRPGLWDNPVLGLVQALTQTQGESGIGLPELLAPGQNAEELAFLLQEAPENSGTIFDKELARLTESARKSGHLLESENAKLVLVVDQLEELFTAAITPENQQLFARLLAGLARSCLGAVWVIATQRADFWHRAMEIDALRDLAQGDGTFYLKAPSSTELAEIIREPARMAGLTFGTDAHSGRTLADLIADEAAQDPRYVLPLLSFLLQTLYLEDVEKAGGHELTVTTYEACGKLEGAISLHAKNTIAKLDAATRQAVPRVLRALVSPSDSSEQGMVARLVSRKKIEMSRDGAQSSAVRAVLDAFISARLVVATERDEVRLAHEALITHWDLAKDELAASRWDIKTRKLIEDQWKRWQDVPDGLKQEGLLHGLLLANAIDLVSRWKDEIDPGMTAFIKESWQKAEEQKNLTRHQLATGIARQAQVEFQNGNHERALRFSVMGAKIDPGLPDTASLAAAQLATVVAQVNLLLTLSGHEQRVHLAAFSPDGTCIITASQDSTARIWNATTGKEMLALQGHKGGVHSAAFSPDGTRIVTASQDKTARIWDAATGQKMLVLQGHENLVNSAAFSPDGSRIVTASWDKTVRIWDAATGQKMLVLQGHRGGVNSAAFSPDGTRIVTTSQDKTARIWDATTGQKMLVLQGHENLVNSAAFSPDGTRIVTASWDKTARIWDAATGKEIRVLQGLTEGVHSAAFSQDGTRIVTTSWGKVVRIWDAASKEIRVLQGHQNSVKSVVFSPDGTRIVTASRDRTARIWDTATGDEMLVVQGHKDVVNSAAFSPDGTRIVTASQDNTARIWNAATGKEIRAVQEHKSAVNSATFSPDGTRIVTASQDNTARIWDAATGKEIRGLQEYKGVGHSATFSPDGALIVTASGNNTAHIWDAATGEKMLTLEGLMGGVNLAAFSPDGAHIVTASNDSTARIWDTATGKEMLALQGHEAPVNSAAFSPDGARIVTASNDKTARIWDAATGKEIQILQGHANEVYSAAFSPDGTRIVTASGDKTVRIWDVHFATLSKEELMIEACSRRLPGLSRLNRDEMRLLGYPDTQTEINVCEEIP